MEYAFGQRWYEFKNVILEFIELFSKKDVDGLEKLMPNHPCVESIFIDNDREKISKFFSAKLSGTKNLLSEIIRSVPKKIKSKYKDFILHDYIYGSRSTYGISINEYLTLNLRSEHYGMRLEPVDIDGISINIKLKITAGS